MGISIDLIYNSARQLLQKEVDTGWLAPEQFNVYANMSVVELFNKYAEIYQNESRITEKLLPFIVRKSLAVDAAGKMLYPSDYVNKIPRSILILNSIILTNACPKIT